MDIFRLAAGLVLVFFGRKLYWLFVGMVGFLAGTLLAGYFSQDFPPYGQLAVAVLCGIVGLVLAIFLQRLAVAIAGGLAAAYFCQIILKQFVFSNTVELAIVAVAFIIGAILAGTLFNWALILFSTLTGSFLVSSSLPVSQTISLVAFLVLVILGLVVQVRAYRKAPAPG